MARENRKDYAPKTFNIKNKARDLCIYVFDVTNKSPKKLRVDVIPEFRTKVMYIFTLITKANLKERKDTLRKSLQVEAKEELEVLMSLSEICSMTNYITENQFLYICKLASELSVMIDNWMKSDEKFMTSSDKEASELKLKEDL